MISIGQKATKPAKTEVRAVESPQVLSLLLLQHVDPGPAFLCSYHSLGCCLRTNIFPGTLTSATLRLPGLPTPISGTATRQMKWSSGQRETL
ncbi:uncharacterized protein LOC116065289 isoform X2 [Sander lucioperca]|uniref:uncharacterized protein LOC116065289 isoform X2 n=1 Tax=Sander lucioperca TaxID=283035 RepID=UPI00125DCEEC|nr:uncharacterized protein LOC116065289 isoform X2 [Sander lucioperca]